MSCGGGGGGVVREPGGTPRKKGCFGDYTRGIFFLLHVFFCKYNFFFTHYSYVSVRRRAAHRSEKTLKSLLYSPYTAAAVHTAPKNP